MKKIAVINDISGFGKCSLCAALPIISSHKMQCCPLVTGVYSNQTGYESFKFADMTEHMQGFIDEWKKLGARFDAIITGFIQNERQGEIISSFILDFKREDTLLVVDPVMADGGEIYKNFDKKRIDAVCSLAKKADIITPNISELCLLCGEDFSNIKGAKALDKARNLAEKFGFENHCHVVVSGIEVDSDSIYTLVVDDYGINVIRNEKHGKSFSGTGDILCAYLTCELLEGKKLVDATQNACTFIEKAIKQTMKNESVDYADGIDFEYFC